MNEFQQVIKAYLDQRAQEDAQFADNYAKPGKSIEKCCNYILRQAKKRGNAVAMPDDEVYGLAVHYYDEDIKADECKPVSGASRVTAPKVELTEEEKAAAREQAVADYRNQQVQPHQTGWSRSTATMRPTGARRCLISLSLMARA